MTSIPSPATSSTMTPTTSSACVVIGGVDTHGQTHHAAVIDGLGRHLGDREFPANPGGYRALAQWVGGHGTLTTVGVEGTGTYGAGLARYLRSVELTVVEVDRPDRKSRRAHGKSDPLDAYAAARAVLSGSATGTPKLRDGHVEAIRALRVARSSAVKARSLTTTKIITTCARLRPGHQLSDPAQATKTALRRLARRHQQLSAEISEADHDIAELVGEAAPDLLCLRGVGPEVAGQLLTSAGDNPDRITSEAKFAHLCGAAPVPASSGRTHRHRLNRGGDRHANNALYIVVLNRLRYDPRTRAYAERRTQEGLSKPEIIRCLKRYVAREIHRVLVPNSAAQNRPARPLDSA